METQGWGSVGNAVRCAAGPGPRPGTEPWSVILSTAYWHCLGIRESRYSQWLKRWEWMHDQDSANGK